MPNPGKYTALVKRVHLPEEERRSGGISEAGTATPVAEVVEDAVRYAIVDPPQDVADLMGLSPGRKVLRKSALRRNSHGEGASTAVFYLPYNVVSANPELLDPTVARRLAARHPSRGADDARSQDHLRHERPRRRGCGHSLPW
ncbi:hypothetical protein [Streptomyces lydicus]|uniref:hypothetical protein n=1 Tax=Streptomyces lydicus TaxID=47763 RepID=UPI0037D5B973